MLYEVITSYVEGDKRAKRHAAGKIIVSVDHPGGTISVRVVTGIIRWACMTVVTSSYCIDIVTTFAYQRRVFSIQINLHWGNPKSLLDKTLGFFRWGR